MTPQCYDLIMKQVRMTLRLPESLHEDLKFEAEKQGKSLNELIVNKIKKQKVAYRTKIMRDIDNITKDMDTKFTSKEILELVRDGRKY